MQNQPSRFWLWDNQLMKFVENEQLKEISNYSGVYMRREEDNRVRAFTRDGVTHHITVYFEYKDGEFISDEILELYYEEIDGEYYNIKKIFKPFNGEMQVVSETKTKADN